jgi:hypothetical protein
VNLVNLLGIAMLALPGIVIVVGLLVAAVHDVFWGPPEERWPAVSILAIAWIVVAGLLIWAGR